MVDAPALSAGSPFARIVRIALLETSLDARVTKQEVTRERLYSANSEVLAFNAVGRVPTPHPCRGERSPLMATPDTSTIFASRLISLVRPRRRLSLAPTAGC